MEIITTIDALKEFCQSIRKEPYIACDTEFIRETTYYPKLCLIQIASKERAVIIDPLAKNMDLSPLFSIFKNKKITKVFHAASQDLEIMYYLSGHVSEPIFDTQVAAMVCGFGDSISYAALVKKLLGEDLDKRHQFTDWAQRPLDDGQLDYAISDVTHLYELYTLLYKQLKESKREEWVAEEIAALENQKTYEVNIERLWRRVKIKKHTPVHLAVVKALVEWREESAKKNNQPRNFIMKDTVISDIAMIIPQEVSDFKRIRNIKSSHNWSEKEVLKIIEETLSRPKISFPQPTPKPMLSAKQKLIYELLKILLKYCAHKNHIAARLIATTDDLVALIIEDAPDIPLLKGWRYQVFGKDAQALKAGKIAFKVVGGELQLIRS